MAENNGIYGFLSSTGWDNDLQLVIGSYDKRMIKFLRYSTFIDDGGSGKIQPVYKNLGGITPIIGSDEKKIEISLKQEKIEGGSSLESKVMYTNDAEALTIVYNSNKNAINYSVCSKRCQRCNNKDDTDCIKCEDGYTLNPGGYCELPCDYDRSYDKETDSCVHKCYVDYIMRCKTCDGPGMYDCLSCDDGYK